MNRMLNIDKTVTLSLVLAILIQTASALLWAGAAEARINTLEVQAQLSLPVSERLARLEEQVSMARKSLTRIEKHLDED